MNTEDADSAIAKRCKHDMILGYCGLCQVPAASSSSSCRPSSIPPRIVNRLQGTEYESPSLEAGSSLPNIPAISRQR